MPITTLEPVLDRLARFTNAPLPVVSLYLDLSADQHGRQTHQAFLERAFAEPSETYGRDSTFSESLRRDEARIRAYLSDELERPGPAGVALFSCSGGDTLFEAIALDTPLDGHMLYVDEEPHLFPLARVAEQYATYAALVLDTNTARLFVCATGAVQRAETIENEKTHRVSTGGWSQARYQRHVEDLHLKHMKEVAEAVERVVRDERITSIILSGEQQAVTLLRKHLHPTVDALIIDVMRLDVHAREHEILRATLEAFRRKDQETDREVVDALLDAYRSRGLATVGVAGVRGALERGQVDELIVPAAPASVAADHASPEAGSGAPVEQRSGLDEETVEALVTEARRTSARLRFIEDASLLEAAGGVGAFLRFRL
ncbi:MAG TPA: Vms1/Ankzf1 family peptidyl-tRNA hydrolase [Luteitalea sp.]|nr:Vms1/Ankzf1 family peptidyl-tRNA hydrolase [Luteitalea sp.]